MTTAHATGKSHEPISLLTRETVISFISGGTAGAGKTLYSSSSFWGMFTLIRPLFACFFFLLSMARSPTFGTNGLYDVYDVQHRERSLVL
jgi:hypothetical protein